MLSALSKAIRLAHRVTQASPQELLTRGRQFWYGCRNWVGARNGGSALSANGHRRALLLGGQADLTKWWQQRRTQWFLSEQRVDQLRSAAKVDASELAWVIGCADEVLSDRLPLFSYGSISYAGPDRWHSDPILGKVADKKFHGLIEYLNPEVVGDSKHVWEPNRFAWATWLGLAYRITGEARYADKFRAWTLDWFRDNPYPIGINYCSALEVAFRNYAWIWSLALFSDYLSRDEELLENLLRGIWIGSRHVEENLSLYFAPNTHILGEAFGLFAVGAAIPEFSDSPRWRRLGLQLLEEEGQKQFFQDGMHRELSSGYQVYAADFYLQATLIGRESAFTVPDTVRDTARQAARRLAELAPSNLQLPQFNDCDGGRLLNLVPKPLDAGPSLMAAEDLFPNEKYLARPTPRRGYALLMSDERTDEAARRRDSFALPRNRDVHRLYDSGLASYRTEAGDYVLLRGSNFGYLDCPHSHDGGLGVILTLGGSPVFVDSGVGSYTQSEDERNWFRGAQGKNTILVAGAGPSQGDGWFTWKKKTDCELVKMHRFETGFVARAKHAGFSDSPERHTFVQREVIMLDSGTVVIVDRWDSDNAIQIESRYTLHPGLDYDPAQKVLKGTGEHRVHLNGSSLNLGEEIEIVDNQQDYSPNYGLKSETKAISLRHPRSCRGGMVTIVSRCGEVEISSDGNVLVASEIQFGLTSQGVQLPLELPLESAEQN